MVNTFHWHKSRFSFHKNVYKCLLMCDLYQPNFLNRFNLHMYSLEDANEFESCTCTGVCYWLRSASTLSCRTRVQGQAVERIYGFLITAPFLVSDLQVRGRFVGIPATFLIPTTMRAHSQTWWRLLNQQLQAVLVVGASALSHCAAWENARSLSDAL